MGSYRIAIPVFGVPVRGKRNPYLVLLSEEELVEVEVDVDEAERPAVRVEGTPQPDWRLRIPLASFVDVVSGRLEQPLDVVVRYRVADGVSVPAASLYAVITMELVTSVAEAAGYEMSVDEVLRAAASIDDEAGVGLDYVKAAREAVARGTSMAYREGEEPVPLRVEAELELVGEEDVAGSFEDELGEQTLNAITRLAGISVVESVSLLREGADFATVFSRQARVDNALYYLLYGLEPPGEGCKWTPSLSSGFGVCSAGRGLGTRVRFR